MATAPKELSDLIARERGVLAVHRDVLRSSAVLPGRALAPRTFLHGFFLPFTLAAASLRTPDVRRRWGRVFGVRLLLLLVLAPLAVARRADRARTKGDVDVEPASDGISVQVRLDEKDGRRPPPEVHVTVPGLSFDVNARHGADAPPRAALREAAPPAAPEAAQPSAALPRSLLTTGLRDWRLLVAALAAISALEAVLVFLSRKYDDWVSFHVAKVAGVRPEDEEEPTPKLRVDLAWLWRKGLRKIHGYVILFAGAPLFAPLLLVPSAGRILFQIAFFAWGLYWLGVVTAGKNSHAWLDAPSADAPPFLRTLATAGGEAWALAPVRGYARLLVRLTKPVHAAVATFERNPRAYLGLASARVVLSLPGLYAASRPVIPVAAGRLCAELDPGGRFWANDTSCCGLASPPAETL
jgi:hypothetical protein